MGDTQKKRSHQSSHYSRAGVDYGKLDHLKVLAQQRAAETTQNIADTSYREVAFSRGESAYLLDCNSHYIAFVQEGLGTKSLVADAVRKYTGRSYYDTLAKDTVAMITNDLITVGARPLSVLQYLAVGQSEWLDDEGRLTDLVSGWKKACDEIGATWGGGETPSLKGIIEAGTVDLAGSAIGVIEPKSRLLAQNKIQDGDVMIGFASSGIHANGVSLARKVAAELPAGYETKLPSGQTFGEALLAPTILYSSVLQDLFVHNVEMHYAVNVTGHGWRKLMRPNRNFCYDVAVVPESAELSEPMELFSFLQTQTKMSDAEMYATFNMGVGFVIYIAAKDADTALKVAGQHTLHAWQLGSIHPAEKPSVIIRPKNITYEVEDLQIRA